ncbi:THAP domain-containing protein 5 isoform X2 [Chrysoperla carnea]|uniref:THAP domain-containing protein 5 isoform X2 n=1 Tax=Chrysoperla carnea TaxID=189513 RepID=UPI001D08CC1F|nr:THAP domain-containing protein 5 isoform X2 [Chrysoperla carnea]
MGSCSAVNCSNRSEKGYKMHKFPANPKQRDIWVRNMKRDNWTPTYASCLCEIKVEKFHQNTDSESEDKYSNSRPRKLPRLEIDENSTTHEEENYSDTFIADNDDELLTKDNLKKKVYDVVETIIQVCQNNTDNTSDDEFDIFGKSVAAQLKSLPLDKALKLQMQLQEQISLFKIRVLQQEATQNS